VNVITDLPDNFDPSLPGHFWSLEPAWTDQLPMTS